MNFLNLIAGEDVGLTFGSFIINGTVSGDETVVLGPVPAGRVLEVELDPSFNGGSNVIQFAGSASDYTIVRSGSSVIIEGNGISATIPVGTTANSIVFGDSDPVDLVGGASGITLGDQVVTTTAAPIEGIDDGGTGTGGGDDDQTFTFTPGVDTFEGGDGDDTFFAPIQQAANGSGAVTNTFESGDTFVGGAGTDEAVISLTSVVTGGQTEGPAISSTSEGVEQFFIRTQYDNQNFDLEDGSSRLALAIDLGLFSTAGDFNNFAFGNAANIDAQENDGVRQWWSDDARADLIIEDIRERSDNVTFGFRDSDPGVSYAAFFDPGSLDSDASDSSLTLTLIDEENPDRQLADFPVDGVTFTLDGETFTLTVPREGSAGQPINTTYAAFTAALNDAIEETEGLEGVVATLNADNTITLEDDEGRSFATGTYSFVNDQVPGTGNLIFNQEVGAPIEGRIETNIVLDGVGRSSEGGAMVIGSMGTRDGVEVFNVTVEDTSWLQALASTNNILEIVNVNQGTSATGDLFLGSGSAIFDTIITSDSGLVVPTTVDDRLSTSGLGDVRVFNAEGFTNELKVGARLTEESFEKYLVNPEEDELNAAGEVQFTYHLGDGGSNLHLVADSDLVSDDDFALDIIGGTLDDRVNLFFNEASGSGKNNIAIDLEGGVNTVALNTNTGTGTSDRFAEFANVDRLVIEGFGFTVQDIVAGNMRGLSEIIIATESGGGASIERAEVNTSIEVSGINQTLGAGESNDDQEFGAIAVLGNANTELDLLVSNTARTDGVLSIDQIFIGNDGAVTSSVRTLNLESAGDRDTTNIVESFSGSTVTTLNLVGTQAIGVVVDALANGIPNSDVTIDASELEASVTIGIGGALLNSGDDDVITGTAGNDRLVLFGALDTNTTVEDIENIQFGSASSGAYNTATNDGANAVSGEFSLANVSGDNNVYSITNTSDALTLTNLSGDVTVNLGVVPGPNGQLINEDIVLEGVGDDDDSILVDFTSNLTTGDDLFTGANDLTISGFGAVTIDISEASVAANPDINLDGATLFDFDDGLPTGVLTVSAAAGQFDDGADSNDAVLVDGVLESLAFTGGSGAGSSLDLGVVATLEATDVLGSIQLIDFRNYEGSVEAQIVNTVRVSGTQLVSGNVDRDILVGNDDIDITLTEVEGEFQAVDTNTTFFFTDATGGTTTAPIVWTINNFVFEADPEATTNNYTVLDFGGLGLDDFADLTIAADGANTVISDASGTWQVVLVNVAPGELGESENLQFDGPSAASVGVPTVVAAEDMVSFAPAEDAMMVIDSFAFA